MGVVLVATAFVAGAFYEHTDDWNEFDLGKAMVAFCALVVGLLLLWMARAIFVKKTDDPSFAGQLALGLIGLVVIVWVLFVPVPFTGLNVRHEAFLLLGVGLCVAVFLLIAGRVRTNRAARSPQS